MHAHTEREKFGLTHADGKLKVFRCPVCGATVLSVRGPVGWYSVGKKDPRAPGGMHRLLLVCCPECLAAQVNGMLERSGSRTKGGM